MILTMRLDYKWDHQKQKVFKFCFGHKKERPTIDAMFIENKIKHVLLQGNKNVLYIPFANTKGVELNL